MSESAGNTGTNEPVFLVEGELVALGPFERRQIDLWVRWMNNIEATRTLGPINVYTREHEERFYEQATTGATNVVSFAIYDRKSGKPIGNTSLREIDHRLGSATFGIMIGEPAYWNRGFGTEATRLVLDYAFNVLGLYNVLLQVFSNNPRGQRAYEKAGFRVVGCRRGAYRIGQQRYDVIIMDSVAHEFESPVLARWLHEPQRRQ